MSGKQIKKAELVADVAERSGVDKKSVAAVVDALGACMTKYIVDGDAVMLPGIGKFSTRARPARTVRNPSTGETIQKPADRAVRITTAKALKDAVN